MGIGEDGCGQWRKFIGAMVRIAMDKDEDRDGQW